MSSLEAVLIQKSTIVALGCWAGTEEYYRSSLEAVLLQKSTTVALGRLGW